MSLPRNDGLWNNSGRSIFYDRTKPSAIRINSMLSKNFSNEPWSCLTGHTGLLYNWSHAVVAFANLPSGEWHDALAGPAR